MKWAVRISVVAVHAFLLVLFLSSGNLRRNETPESSSESAAPSSVSSSEVNSVSRTNAEEKDHSAPSRIEPAPRPAAPSSVLSKAIIPLNPALEKEIKRSCRTGILVDWDKRNILWQKRSESPVPVASMTKIMTALLLVDYVRKNSNLSTGTIVPVTRTASKIGGSEVWMDPREQFSVEEILQCMLIHSANDAAHLAGEFVSGSKEKFVELMNQRAGELALDTCKFYNANGLPAGGGRENVASARDIARLAGLALDKPEIMKWAGTWFIRIEKDSNTPKKLVRRDLVNRNKLVKTCDGVTGLKTGFTNQAGYCVAATCTRNGRTWIAVVTGCESQSARNALISNLFDWAEMQ